MLLPEREKKTTFSSKVIKNWAVEEETGEYVFHMITSDRDVEEKPSEDALQEARQLVREAEEEAAEIKKCAFREGYEKGYREGAAEGKTEEQARMEESCRQVLEVLHQAECFRAERIAGMEKEILNLAVAMAEKIVCAQLSLDDESLVHMTKHAIKSLVSPEYITIHAHPRDAEILNRQKRILSQEVHETIPVNIVREPDIPQGSCLLETDKGTLDASLNIQLLELKKTLEIA